MKKLFIILTGFLLVLSLAACGKSDKTNKSSSSSHSTSSKKLSSSSKSASSTSSSTLSSSSSESSSGTFKTESGSQTDLAQARRALYQAGINTANISDEQILSWWNEAKTKGVDFVQYAQSQMQ